MRGAAWVVGFCLMALLSGCFGDGSRGEDGDAAGASGDSPGPHGPVDRQIDVEIRAIPCPPGYDNGQDDDVCLAYDGKIPGPTWVFNAGERVQITLHNRVAETLEALAVDTGEARELAEARFSLHRHGLSLDACSDGVAQPIGTEICDSTVGPGESINYTFETLFPGFWHYHDHATAFTTSPMHGPILGAEGLQRGLWGSFVVLPSAQTTDRVIDLHLMDTGPNAGSGVGDTASAGERFDLVVVGLGYWHRFYEVRLEDPDGDTIGEVLVGPGVSRGITVHDARPGTYTWTAEGVATMVPGSAMPVPQTPESFTGTITVTDGPSEDAEAEGTAAAERSSSSHRDHTARAAPAVADKVFVIPFNFAASSALVAAGETMGLPLLEATVGEVVEFRVESTDGFPHVFHLHGHPWVDPGSGDFIDAVPLVPAHQTSHNFTVVAGLDAGHAGDWFYHCHIGHDEAMWGVLRVHP